MLWTNLIAVDVGGERPPESVRDAVRAAVPPHGVPHHVLEEAQPDAAVFFVGPNRYYGWEVRQQFEGLETEPVAGHDASVMERLRHPALPDATFRTYHPGYLQREGLWDIVDALPGLVRAALGRSGG